MPDFFFKDEILTCEFIKTFPVGGSIEIQNPNDLVAIDGYKLNNVIRNISMLINHGIDVWIDDLTPSLFEGVLRLELPISGVKVDKCVINTLNDSEFNGFIDRCFSFVPSVIIEGIETNEQKIKSQKSNASYGQGWLWPQLIVPL